MLKMDSGISRVSSPSPGRVGAENFGSLISCLGDAGRQAENRASRGLEEFRGFHLPPLAGWVPEEFRSVDLPPRRYRSAG